MHVGKTAASVGSLFCVLVPNNPNGAKSDAAASVARWTTKGGTEETRYNILLGKISLKFKYQSVSAGRICFLRSSKFWSA